ncbi:CTQ-dependent glycine oxidase GoxA [uncultured Tateyamaria sp.]|uniref:CTQ-dependent glycine oxidase GoxA n=1 Tax=uncultured Tateyamaria sp. TaxID=455651 RepID=UPI0026113440|nr:CTQ-dependent glycine oxidase GoxA [uncultured Tateyamaria sp.]
MTDHSTHASRRQFLGMASSAALIAGAPMPARANIDTRSAYGAAPSGAAVAKVRIYPAIGICRVGGAESWFYAPEVPGLPPMPADGNFKDGLEKVKKQVQRFRVYAFDDEDNIIGEVTGDGITWGVHLANTKANWYGFNNPLDNGDLAPGLPSQKRNQYFVSDQDREENLIIDGGLLEISGADTNAGGGDPDYQFEGTFWGGQADAAAVGLGQLRTDDAGRLMVVPPDGVSNSPSGAAITSFADNNAWHDDWCDGPVTASVEINGEVFEAEPSWVACVGPNFAPEIPPITTMYDVVADMNVQAGWADLPDLPISFMTYIYPTFRRIALMEWVTQAANLRQGWMAIGDLGDPAYVARLADPSPENEAFRMEIFDLFRDPYNLTDSAYIEERLKIPYMLGDGVNYDGSPLQWFQFPKLQYEYLRAWAAGAFVDDYNGQAAEDAVTDYASFDDIPLELQPGALTQAALEPLSGGAFHPGVELTYYLRLKEMYAHEYDDGAELFRIAHGDRDSLNQNLGRLLTPDVAFNGFGDTPPPIGPQMAGDLTRWMGLPWQCDAFSCQQVLMQQNYPTAVWWPALLPIDVLPEAYYAAALDDGLTQDERDKFLDSRISWSRGVAGIGYHANGSYWDGITNMITVWERMGFVVRMPSPRGDVFVEMQHADNMETRFDWRPSQGMLPN